MKKFLKNNHTGIILVFLLCIPFFNNIITVPKGFSDLENRVLTTDIKWDKDMLKSGVLAERVENFVQDQFPLRDLFVFSIVFKAVSILRAISSCLAFCWIKLQRLSSGK